MKIRIKDILKNKQGSSLAFVLIIGMIIMIMVASLLAVANSDFTFTQETVESRQAYIDAKSVIEFGKIEINNREKKLSDEYDALVKAKNDEEDTTQIENRIVALETKITPIYGNDENAVDTLSFLYDSTKKILGKVFIVKNPLSTGTTDTSQYIFKVETENLRRKLDYQVDYSYAMTTGGTGSGSGTPGSVGSTATPTRPALTNLLNPNMGDSGWATAQITVPSWPTPSCNINNEPTGNFADQALTVDTHSIASKSNVFVDIFAWANEPTLNLIAKNICFGTPYKDNEKYGDLSIPIDKVNKAKFNITATGEGTVDDPTGQIRFKGNYIQNNNEKNTLKASYVIFDGDLNLISSRSTLDITCDTLLIKGDIRVCYPVILIGNDGSYSNLNINAKNIIIEGNVYVGSYSNLSVNCPNIWIDGNINTIDSISKLEFSNVNYLKTGNINIGDTCQLLVTGADKTTSQVDIKSIGPSLTRQSKIATAYKIKMYNLWSFSCTGLNMNYSSTLELSSNVVLINGGFTLGPQAGLEDVLKDEPSLLIKTQYFNCTGMTKIDDLKDDFAIKRIDNELLYVRFEGGYTQTGSNSGNGVSIGEDYAGNGNNVTIRNADMVVFGDDNTAEIKITDGKVNLAVWAESIYLASQDISINDDKNNRDTKFSYYNGYKQGDKMTNFFIKTDVKDFKNPSTNFAESGSYLAKGYFPRQLNNRDPSYEPPSFPKPPGSSGSSSVIITQGAEKYY